jgi:hypothetical protein
MTKDYEAHYIIVSIILEVGVANATNCECKQVEKCLKLTCIFPSGHIAQMDTNSARQELPRECCWPRMVQQLLLSQDKHF